MPLTNGHIKSSTINLSAAQQKLDFSTAVEVLSEEYPNGDGLDAKTLLDSKINGGLTYNDFLVMPGYIGSIRSSV